MIRRRPVAAVVDRGVPAIDALKVERRFRRHCGRRPRLQIAAERGLAWTRWAFMSGKQEIGDA